MTESSLCNATRLGSRGLSARRTKAVDAPEFVSGPPTVVVPPLDDVLAVAPFPHSFAAFAANAANAANDVYGESLWLAGNVTTVASAPCRVSEAMVCSIALTGRMY